MVRKLIILLTIILIGCSAPKKCCSQTKQVDIKKLLKFSTFYAAVNGGTSLSDVDIFSVDNGLSTQTVSTPYDYNFTIGLRKIARFGYENKAQTFYDGTESNYSDAATVGKVRGVEYLFEVDYKRQEGVDYMDQHHFIRFSSDEGCPDELCVNFFALKVEYLEDGFADIKYFEASERYRHRKGKNVCTVHEKKEQRKDGKEVRCSLRYPTGHKKAGQQCSVMTTNKSGYCYYHD